MSWILLVIGLLALKGMALTPPGEFNRESIAKPQTMQIEGLFALLVVMSHYRNDYLTPGAADAAYIAVQSHLGQCIVATFLFYSGYGMVTGVMKRGFDYVGSLPGRFLRLWLRFGAVVLIYAAVQAALGRVYPAERVLLALTGWTGLGNSNWYVFCVLCLYAMMFVSFLPCRRCGVTACMAMFTLLTLGWMLMMRAVGRDQWWYDTALLFVLGGWYALGKRPMEQLAMRSDTAWWLTLAVTAVLYTLAAFNKRAHFAVYECWIMLFMVLVLLLGMKVRLQSSLLTFAGQHVFSLYMLQRLPMLVLNKLGFTAAHPYAGLVVVFAVSFVLAVGFDTAWNWLLRRVCPNKTAS